MLIAIYSRKSKFTGKGESVENQIQICKDYFTRLDTPDEIHFSVYEDEGYSGKNTNRPNFQRMMDDIKGGKISSVICYRLDRLTRSVSDFSTLLETLQSYSVDFVSVKESFDTSTPMGRAMIYIASVFAQLERETIAERVKDNKMQLAKQGKWQGGSCPVGTKAAQDTHTDQNSKKRTAWYLQIDEGSEELQFVETVFSVFESTGSLAGTQKYLLSHNILTQNGKEISLNGIRQILTNPIYTENTPEVYDYLETKGCILANEKDQYCGNKGLISYGKTGGKGKDKRVRQNLDHWIIAIGRHRPVISGSRWVSVMCQIDNNADKAPRMNTSNYSLFSNIIRCGCGGRMRVAGNRVTADGETQFYYRCIRKDQSRGTLCQEKPILGRQFDHDMVKQLKQILDEELNYLEDIKENGKYLAIAKQSTHSDITAKEKKIQQLNSKIENLILKLAESECSPTLLAGIEKAVNKLSLEADDQKAELETLKIRMQETEADQHNIDFLQQSIYKFNTDFDISTFDEKRNMIKNIVKEIRCSNGVYDVLLYSNYMRKKYLNMCNLDKDRRGSL